MASLTVWRFPTPLGVETGEIALARLQEQGAITVLDAVALTWLPADEHPRVRRLHHDTARSAAVGGFWGAVVGMVVLAPVAGAAVGAAGASLVERLRRTGIDDTFVDGLRDQLGPGTSALFLLSRDADPELVRPVLARTEATLIQATLDDSVTAELAELLVPPGQSPHED